MAKATVRSGKAKKAVVKPDKILPFRIVLARFMSAHADAKTARKAMNAITRERPDDVFFVMEMPHE